MKLVRAGTRGSLIALVLGLVWLAPAADATSVLEPVLDQSFENVSPNSRSAINRGLDKAQTFTNGITGTLTRVDVIIGADVAQSGDLYFDVRPTVGGRPVENNAASLIDIVIPRESLPTLGREDWVEIDVSSFALAVTAGDLLAIVLRDPESTGQRFFSFSWLEGNGGPGYPRGKAFGRTAGVGWDANDNDHGFRTFVEPIPEPSTVLLLGLGLAGLATSRRR